jgi:hypothetical protein
LNGKGGESKNAHAEPSVGYGGRVDQDADHCRRAAFRFPTDIYRNLAMFTAMRRDSQTVHPSRLSPGSVNILHFACFQSSFGIGGQTMSFAGQIRIFSNFFCNL